MGLNAKTSGGFGLIGLAALAVAGCATISAPHPLEGTNWRLIDVTTSGTLTRLTAELSSRHRLSFLEEGRLQIQLDCNRGNADWTASRPSDGNGTLNIGRVAATRALCPRPTFGEELAAVLPQASGYTLNANGATMVIRTPETTYVFARD
jgi:heat shock protein HslJ